MNLDNIKSDVHDTSGTRKHSSKKRNRNRGIAGVLGAIPFLLGVLLVALRFDAVRNQLFRVWPQSRKLVDRYYGRGIGQGDTAKTMRSHERTPYGEA